MDWTALLLSSLLIFSSIQLAHRFWRRRNWLIFSAIVTRLYLAIIWVAVTIGALSMEERVVWLRFGVGFLVFIEIISRFINHRDER